MSLVRQLPLLASLAFANVRRSRWASAAIVACILLVVVVVAIFLSMASGFEAAARNTGSDSVAVVLGQQSTSETNSQLTREQVELIADAPGVAERAETALVSPELTITVNGQRTTEGRQTTVLMRGMGEAGLSLRSGFRLVSGRLYSSGGQELIIGERLARQIGGGDLVGKDLVLAGRPWRVVGIFALDSPVFEGEYWTDLASLQSAYSRPNSFQSVRLRLVSPDAVDRIQEFADNDPRLGVDVVSERKLYERQAEGTANLIRTLGWPLGAVLSLGSMAGVLNIMGITMRTRRRPVQIMRMIGFSRGSVIAIVLIEMVALAVLGALLGAALVYFLFNGSDASMVGSAFTTVNYDMRLTGGGLLRCLLLAIAIGLIGGFFPAWRLVSK